MIKDEYMWHCVMVFYIEKSDADCMGDCGAKEERGDAMRYRVQKMKAYSANGSARVILKCKRGRKERHERGAV